MKTLLLFVVAIALFFPDLLFSGREVPGWYLAVMFLGIPAIWVAYDYGRKKR